MIDYKDFVIPEFYWDYFVREKRSLFISSYLKDNNILPSEDMIKNFIIEEKEREDFRRMLYSKYCVSGVMPEIPNVPVLPDNPDIPGETIKIVNVTFGIEINDFIPFNDGIAETNNNVVNIFKNGINFMHLLEKDDKDIEVIISNDKEYIILSNLSDFNKTYNIPAGTYNISGHIGERGGTDINNPIIRFNETLEIHSSGEIKLHALCDDLLIISDKEFEVVIYKGSDIETTYKCYNYNNYYYMFWDKYWTFEIINEENTISITNESYNYTNNVFNNILYYYINSKNDGEKYVNIFFNVEVKELKYKEITDSEPNEELIIKITEYYKNEIEKLINNFELFKIDNTVININKLYTLPKGYKIDYEIDVSYLVGRPDIMGSSPKLILKLDSIINESGYVKINGIIKSALIISNGDFGSPYYKNGYNFLFSSDFNTSFPINEGEYSYLNSSIPFFEEKKAIICTYDNRNIENQNLFSKNFYENNLHDIIDKIIINDEYYSYSNFFLPSQNIHTIKITLKEKTNMNNLSFEETCLTSIIIPENISILSSEENILTFKNCSQLNKIICKTLEPPTFPENINPFEGIKEGGLLQVRKGTKEKYIKWMDLLNNWAIQEIEIEE